MGIDSMLSSKLITPQNKHTLIIAAYLQNVSRNPNTLILKSKDFE
jgi:hypothetical protein